jgi:hypothetical protein
MAKKTAAQKQEAKQLKIKAREQKQQEKFAYAAADGKISGSEIGDLFGSRGFKFGGKTFGGMSREEQASALAKFALGNPNVAIGKGASELTGLKIKTDEKGSRFATYTPEMAGGGRGMDGSPTSLTQVTPNFGKANASWSAIGGGKFIYGGAPGTRVSFAGDTTGLTEPLSGAGSTGNQYLDTTMGDSSSTTSSGGTSSVTDPAVTAQLPSISTGVGSTATGFKTRKSSRNMAKGKSKGFGSMKIGTGSTFSSTINIK